MPAMPFRQRLALLFCIVFLLPLSAKSAHLVGGELSYECLGGNQYEISLNVYKNAASGIDLELVAFIYAIDRDNNTVLDTLFAPQLSLTLLPENDIGCVIGAPVVETQNGYYQGIMTLPVNGSGYDIVYQRCCRTLNSNNVFTNGGKSSVYILTITREGLISCNDGPDFVNPPPILACNGSRLVYDQSAVDNDGDEITYSWCNPLEGNLTTACDFNGECPATITGPLQVHPFVPLVYGACCNVDFPASIGVPDPLSVDPVTGLLTGTVGGPAVYQLAICIQEWRNGVLLSSTVRDFQLTVADCEIVIAITDPEYRSCSRTVDFNNGSIASDNWIWDFGDGNTSTEFEPSHTYATAGIYNVTLSASQGVVCTDMTTAVVIVEEGPETDFSVDEICSGDSYTFDNLTLDPGGSVSGYEWTIEGNSYNDFEPSVTFNNSGSIDVQLVASTDSGCVDTLVMQMTVRDPIVVDVDIADFYCSNIGIQFNNNSTGYIDGVLWDFGDGNTSTDFSPIHDYASQGTYTVTVTLFNTACGNEVFVKDIDVQFAPPIDLGPSLDICSIGNTTYTMDTTGFGNATVTWSTGDSGPTATLTGGMTSLSVIVDNGGCITMDTVAVNNSSPIVIDIDVPDVVCSGAQLVISNNSTGTIDATDWDFGDGNTSSDFSPVHTYASQGQYTVSVLLTNAVCGNETYDEDVLVKSAIPIELGAPIDVCNGIVESLSIDTTGFNGALVNWSTGDSGPTAYFDGSTNTVSVMIDNLGCLSGDTVTINSIDSIIVDIDIPDLYCSGTVLAFTNNSTGTIESILWDFGDGNTSTDFSPTHSYATGGMYTVSVDLINSVCGSKSHSEDIDVQDPLSIELGAPRSICEGSIDSFSIDTTGFNGATISWSTGESVPMVYVTGGTISNLAVTVDNGCIATDDVDIITVDSIALDVTILDNYCAGISLVFANNSSGDIESVLWDFGNGDTSTDFAPTYTYPVGGQYTITVDLINTLCGSKSFSKDVSIQDPVNVDLGADRDICEGDMEIFTIDTTGFGNASISWSTGETTPSVTVTGGTITSLSVVVDNGCLSGDTIQINNFDSISVDILLDDSYCAADAVDFINNSTGDIQSIIWDFGDGNTSTEFSPSHIYTSGGQFTVSVDLINTVCGSKNFTKTIRLVAPLPVELGPAQDICPGLIQTFSIDTTGFNGATVIWSTGETTPSVDVIGGSTGLSITIDNGCITSDEVILTSECPIFVPSAFVPGGINNTFNVIDLNINDYEMRIYNRWGEKVFTTSDIYAGWDGTFKGVDAEMDVYVYIVDGHKTGGSTFLKSGTIMLVR